MEYNIFTVEEKGFGESHDFQDKPLEGQKAAFEVGGDGAYVNTDGVWVPATKEEAFAVVAKFVTSSDF